MDSQKIAKLRNGWTPPDGLNRSTPREVSLTAGGMALMVMAAFLALTAVAGPAMVFVTARHQAADELGMRQQGQDTEGVVRKLWRAGGKNDRHRVSYQFSVDGRPYEGAANIGRRHWNGLKPGSPIKVRYLTSDPSHNYPSADPPQPLPPWFPFVMGISVAAIAVMLPLMVQRQRRLLEEGRPAPGIVTKLRRIHTQHGTQNRISYEFPLMEGGTAKGTSNGKARPEGTAVCVLYMPHNPRRNSTYPMALVKLSTS